MTHQPAEFAQLFGLPLDGVGIFTHKCIDRLLLQYADRSGHTTHCFADGSGIDRWRGSDLLQDELLEELGEKLIFA